MAPSMPPAARVRERLKQILERDGWTQREFTAKLANEQQVERSQPWLQKILAGENDLRLDDLDAVAHVLKVPTSELVRDFEDLLIELTPSEWQAVQAVRRMAGDLKTQMIGILEYVAIGAQIPKDLQKGVLRQKRSLTDNADTRVASHGAPILSSSPSADFIARVHAISQDLAELAITAAATRPDRPVPSTGTDPAGDRQLPD